MLCELIIKDVVLITDLHLHFKAGLSALTGETGAGKSILLDSLGLAMGQRAEIGLIRKTCDKAMVNARFELPRDHEAIILLQDQDIHFDEDESSATKSVIVKRVISKDGRSKAYINDQAVSVKFLAEIGERLIDIHGQFETHGLMNSRNHASYIDMFGGFTKEKTRTAQLFIAWANARTALREAQDALHEIEREEQWLRTSLEDLEKLQPSAGEEEQLLAQRAQVAHHASTIKGLAEASNALESQGGDYEGSHDALTAINTSIKALSRIADISGEGMDELITRMEASYAELADIASSLQDRLYEIETGGNDLDTIDHRLHSYRVQSRKHRCTSDDLETIWSELQQKLGLLDGQDEKIAALEAAMLNAKNDYHAAAQDLSAARKKAAQAFDTMLVKELPALKLTSADFKTDITEKDERHWSAEGIDNIAFTIKTNAGSSFAPLDKSASGGELSRIMLALKVVLSRVSPVPVMVFDEVDSGMGGATADALGERLANLAQNLQVLVVTHAPQIAARAGQHMVVRKQDTSANETQTQVIELKTPEDRLNEIARMLSGAQITDAARAAAQSLMQNAKTNTTKAA